MAVNIMYTLRETKCGNYIVYTDSNGAVRLYSKNEHLIPGTYSPTIEQINKAYVFKNSKDRNIIFDDLECQQYYFIISLEAYISVNCQDEDPIARELTEKVIGMLS